MHQAVKMVSEQMRLLTAKGYDEKSLYSPYSEGWLRSELKQHIQKAFRNMYYDGSSTDFQISPLGKNDDGSDLKFKLWFHFDGKSSSLRIPQVTLYAGSDTVTVVIAPGGELPNARDLLDLIRMRQAATVTKNPPRRVWPPRNNKGLGK